MESIDNSNMLINDSKYILTLRYNPNLLSNIKASSWKNFTTTVDDISLDFIDKSISDHIVSVIPSTTKKISVSLSGGVDSTLALILLRKIRPDLKIYAYSIKFSDSVDETMDAANIASKFNVDHKIIFLENYLSELPKAISIIKQPFWDIHWYYLVKHAKSFSPYMMSGDGGDELFGGYTFRYTKFLSLVNANSTPLEKTKAYIQCHERDHVPDQSDIFTSNFSWDDIYSIIMPFFDNPLPILSQVFLADYNGKMIHNFSPINNNINSYFNIMGIAPIMNDQLINKATHLQPAKKYDVKNNIGKVPLRKLLTKLGADSLIQNKKLGFSVNTSSLWNMCGKNLCQYYLDNSRLVENKLINSTWIEKHINNDNLDVRYINKFLGLLSYELWYRIFITKELNSDVKLTS